MLKEFANSQGYSLECAAPRLAPKRHRSSARRKRAIVHNTTVHVTQDIKKRGECDSMLVYLTSQTWTRAEASRMFALEVRRAMDAGVPLLLVHEMIGVGGQETRYGCEFASFFSCDDGATPLDLLSRGIYATIAVALKGGEWRKTSMAMLAKAFAGTDAVGEDDANELKSTQEMSKVVQQELGIPASAHAAALMTALGRTTAAETLGHKIRRLRLSLRASSERRNSSRHSLGQKICSLRLSLRASSGRQRCSRRTSAMANTVGVESSV